MQDINADAAVKQYEIAREVGRRIVTGIWKAGERIPPMAALKQEFGVAIATLQRAMDHLQDGGFLIAQRGRGTFVNAEAPCLRRFGMVFPALYGAHNWSLLYEALLLSGRAHSAHEFVFYFGLGATQDPTEHARLVRDVETFQIGGLFFAVNPFELKGSSVLADALPIPRIAVMSSSGGYRDILSIYPSLESFADLAVERIRIRGFRKIAFLATAHHPASLLDRMRRTMAPYGISIPDRWVQGVPWTDPVWAHNCVLNLFDPSVGERPEVLVITDDHLVKGAMDGLRAATLEPGRDVEVIADINMPSPTPPVPGVTYAGADIAALLEHAVMMVESRRLGRPHARSVTMDALLFDFPARKQT